MIWIFKQILFKHFAKSINKKKKIFNYYDTFSSSIEKKKNNLKYIIKTLIILINISNIVVIVK